MSNVSVKSVTAVQITVSEDMAALLRAIVYITDWSQFPDAEAFVDGLGELGIDEVGVYYDHDEAQIKRA